MNNQENFNKSKSNFMTKKNLIIGIVVLIALIGGVVLWQQKNNQQDTKQQANREVVKQTQGQKTTKEQTDRQTIDDELKPEEKIDTSDWKTYRNEEFGFEVKYPRGWKVDKTHVNTDEGILYPLDKVVLSSQQNNNIFGRFEIDKYVDDVTFDNKFLFDCFFATDNECSKIKSVWLPDYWFAIVKNIQINQKQFIFNNNKDNMILSTVHNKKYFLFRNITDLMYENNRKKNIIIDSNNYNIFMNILKTFKFIK